MRQIRLRIRYYLIIILTILSLIMFSTFYTILHKTNEIEQKSDIFEKWPSEKNLYHHQNIEQQQHIPFWQALDAQNIYDVNYMPTNHRMKNKFPINVEIIENLFQLVDSYKLEIITDKQLNINEFDRVFIKRTTTVNNKKYSNQKEDKEIVFDVNNGDDDTNKKQQKDVDDFQSGEKPSKMIPIEKVIDENDKQQLRKYIINMLWKWKRKYREMKQINLAELLYEHIERDEPLKLNTTWFEYLKTVTNLHLYNTDSQVLKHLLDQLLNNDVIQANELAQGTQIKLVLQLSDGIEGLLKPYRVPRNYQTLPDHYYFSDIERHHAEIASFHLDRIIGFNRVPPLIGRILNITGDLREHATPELAKTFFISPANNTCFRGHCSYYCDTAHAVCGRPRDYLEGSIQILLPRPPVIEWQKITHPYRRSYSAVRKAKWESNVNYCYDKVFTDDRYHNRLILDMIDLAVFDFLIGNLDRHHMMKISSFGLNSALIHLDNGRSFGRYDHDELTILTPIRQCCLFRYSTFQRLKTVYKERLSLLLYQSLKTERLKTILINEHLVAVDRRLDILFHVLNDCIKQHSVVDVLVDDGI
ncbi:unnamed protein product [Didymodactylos carnosus]|uniref:FAM20 C-terminal domain-containing protein n=1 Tax=Didymodactylos carnosus TaxID=1234261 RepID=A0A8S2GQE4_9BILA|nr:unnamed protein product [Didymodactylos carnosus]CAF3538419.1 unnamed protein product [Didymodactylos carnosus]